MRRVVGGILIWISSALTACTSSPVVWGDARALPDWIASIAVVSDSITFAPEHVLSPAYPQDPGVCRGSVRFATYRGTTHAVWWSVRADSTAALVASSSTDDGET